MGLADRFSVTDARGIQRPGMRILDLRQISTRQLSPLLEEEARVWRNDLHWDYRASMELIKRFLDTHSLAGCVAMDDQRPAGYGFYVIEEHKGMLGSLFVSLDYPQAELGGQILKDIVESMRGAPQVRRIEMQLMPFGGALAPALTALGFRIFPRNFMLKQIPQEQSGVVRNSPSGLRIERWQDRCLEPCAELVRRAYAEHVDAEINDQYRTREGASKFLKNIVVLPGCGQFEASASFVARDLMNDKLAGVVLTSIVARGVGHTTQLCVLPEYRGRGLGKLLMETSLAALARGRCTELSLTVTSQNASAVKLYETLGFKTLKTFSAGVWDAAQH